MRGRFSCVRCGLMTPVEEGTATARGLSCRTCARAPTPVSNESGLDTLVKVLFSPKVLIPVLLLVIVLEFALIREGFNDLLARLGR